MTGSSSREKRGLLDAASCGSDLRRALASGSIFADRIHETAAPVDEFVDAAFARLRGSPVFDRLFVSLTRAAEFSLLWHGLAALSAYSRERPAADWLRSALLIGAESVVVNGLVKSVFRRARPALDSRYEDKIRIPLTSSFPSGHSSAAFFAATVLSDGSASAAAWYGLAAAVAASRVYVGIHHASDVVAGAFLGTALGRVARRFWPRQTSRRPTTGSRSLPLRRLVH
ncbi:MAG: hypothetical protein KatS3mg008_0768 [Acidimicrobiales bacterium]|nr:MAG: hypothetical protein KatS3mg008_0768 [Acidimicrobiales bacterium]